MDKKKVIDWTELEADIVRHIFSFLNKRDQASLSSTCPLWRDLGESLVFWRMLDLRHHMCDEEICHHSSLRVNEKLLIKGRTCHAVLNLEAYNLKELSVEACTDISGVSLCVLVARYHGLECLKLGLVCNRISSDGHFGYGASIKLKKMPSIFNALSDNCRDLREVGFVDCKKVDEIDLGEVLPLRFLSVAGTDNVNWM